MRDSSTDPTRMLSTDNVIDSNMIHISCKNLKKLDQCEYKRNR